MRVFLHFILTVVKDNDLHVKILLLNINYLGHGTCIGYDVCQCNVSWSGAACNIPDCSAVNNCSGQGNCIGVNTCSCYPLFDGQDCSQKAAKNLHAPVFERSLYRVNISENAPFGTNACQWFWFGKKWSHILFHERRYIFFLNMFIDNHIK